MFTYKKVFCDILKCTKYEYKSSMSSTLSDSSGNVMFQSGFGTSSYDGKPIQEKVPFIEIDGPFHYLYIPESKFNTFTKLLIRFHIKFHKGITVDNKRFYTTSPNKIGDTYISLSKDY